MQDQSTSDKDAARVPVVGIGASAGGVSALSRLFQHLPPDLGAAYVVVVHLAPDRNSELPAILSRETPMPLVQVGDDASIELQADHVYVIAPDRKLEISGRTINARRFDQPRGKRAVIDDFFSSLAATNGAIFAIVLSGGGSDGTIGAKAVKAAGGFVLVQDPSEASQSSMPHSVIATGIADLVLPVDEISARLAEQVRYSKGAAPEFDTVPDSGRLVDEKDEQALQRVLDMLRRETRHDFSKYKRATVLRRLGRRMQLNKTQTIADYRELLDHNAEEIQDLFNDLLISVTTFFRDPQAWTALRERVIGPLVERTDDTEVIRCWVVGCATGEEAFTLAMVLAEEIERRKLVRDFTVFATDIDQYALGLARKGRYSQSISADVPVDYLKRWFRRRDDHYVVVGELRERVVFAHHSLQRDPPFSRMHLISCRNLLIYLKRELQDQIMAIFRYASRDDGHLFLGASESANTSFFRALDKRHRILQARENNGGRKRLLAELPSGAPPALPARQIIRRPDRADTQESHRIALEEHAPPSILVDQNWDIVFLSETAGRYMQPRGGPVSHATIELVRPELRSEVTLALRHAFDSGEQWLSEFVTVHLEGRSRRVAVLAQARNDREDDPRHALVLFLEAGAADADSETEMQTHPSSDYERALLEKIRQSERQTSYLRTEHHAAEEDLRAANEELQSLNEEFRSTTEELETSKEELQSINEELQTVNVELKSKLEETARGHDDLENLMSATNIATLFLDRDLSIKRFTPPLADIFKVRPLDLGRPISDINHNLDYRSIERDARQVLANLSPIERRVSADDGCTYILGMRPYRTAEDRIQGIVVTLVDVTELTRTEKILRESEQRFRALVDASAQIVWSADVDGKVIEDSPSWLRFTGQTAAQSRGSGWLQAIHPDDRDETTDRWREMIESRTSLNHEFRLCHAPSGEYRWTGMRAVPLAHPHGVLHGWIAMNTDVHERKVAEYALRESGRRKDEFVAMLGHELRNPLAAIRHSIEYAFPDGPPDGDTPAADPATATQALVIIDRQSRHMTRLVNDLLDFGRIVRDKLELRRQATEVCARIQEVIAALRNELESGGLTLVFEPPENSLLVDADPDRLVQILDNLLRNAIACTEPGGEVSIDARKQGEQALISVRDTGSGIEADDLEKLFEPYRQLGKVSSKSGLGLGLGLAVVKRLTELHGGQVTARSAGRGKGSEFEFTMPLAHSLPPVERASADGRSLSRLRVLVVDDEADVANALARVLERLGQEVVVAHDGESAIRKAADFRPRIAFLDLSMPGISGKELARRLRDRFSEDQLALIALSGHDRRTDLARGGVFQRHLLKPADIDTIVATLRSIA